MKLAFALPHALRIPAMIQPWEPAVTGADQTRMVKRADALGYDMVAVPEHLVVPRDHVDLSGPHYFHATTAQAYIAGATEHIRVNSCVSILPLQHPIVTAKALATADWLSSGRMVATFGVGWMAQEFDNLGVPFRERGAISDEYLEAIIELWTSDTPRFAGKYINFDEIAFEPKPVQKPHLPIWIGGDADAALRRAARFGSGWWPFMTRPEDIPARLDVIKSHPTFDGRPFEVMFGLAASQINERHESTGDTTRRLRMSAEQMVDRLGELQQLGVTISSLPIPQVDGVEAYLDHAQWVMEEVKPKLG
jgi:probable F420-dependent oxidoreductase